MRAKRKIRSRPGVWGRLRRQGQRGQAMVEYAIVSALILGGLTVAGTIFLPNMIRAYNIYYKSFYAILNLPIP